MNLKLENVKGYSVLTVLDERIDAHNSGELKQYLLQMVESGEKRIIVDLGYVRFIDSSGLGALLSGNKNILAKSGTLALTNIQQQVLAMFELTRLNRVFDIYAELNEVINNDS
jgi:anti-sigma B factor antagonist